MAEMLPELEDTHHGGCMALKTLGTNLEQVKLNFTKGLV